MKPQSIKREVSIPAKMAYGVGQSLISVKHMLFHFFFLYFFANVMGVSEILVMAATFIALIIDAITDPIMGQISDNTRSKRWGRRHKYMLWGILPTAMGLAFLFSPPTGMSQAGLFFWMLGFLLLVRIGLTVYGVPYYALGTELSTRYNERTNIMTVRVFFENVSSLFVFIIGLLIFLPETPEFEDGMMNKAGYSPFVTTMAIIGIVGALICVFGTKPMIPKIRRYDDDPRTKWTSTFSEMKSAFSLKPFRALCWGYCLIAILYGFGASLSFYMGGYLWQFTQVQKFLIAVAPLLFLPFAMILASWLAAKMDKKPAICVFVFAYFICVTAPYALFTLGLTPPIESQALITFIIVINALAVFAFAGIVAISYSMLADLTDVMEAETGKRQEGILNAAFSFIQKITFVFGTGTASLCLMLINFPKQTDPSAVPQTAINGLATVSIIAGVAFSALALFSYRKYGLTRTKLEALQAELRG